MINDRLQFYPAAAAAAGAAAVAEAQHNNIKVAKALHNNIRGNQIHRPCLSTHNLSYITINTLLLSI